MAQKRKSGAVQEPARKRAREEHINGDASLNEGASPPYESHRDEGSDSGNLAHDIRQLEEQIHESKKYYNNIVKLLDLAQDEVTPVVGVKRACVALSRVFLWLLAKNAMSVGEDQSEKAKVTAHWLRDRLQQFKKLLLELLRRRADASTMAFLVLRIIKDEMANPQRVDDYQFPKAYFSELMGILLGELEDDAVLGEFMEKHAQEHDDIRYHVFVADSEMMKKHDANLDDEAVFDRVFSVLSFFDDIPTKGEDMSFYFRKPSKKTHPVLSTSQHKARAQEAWLALLNRRLSPSQRKLVLGSLSETIAPWFSKPELLMDFLTDSYNVGGATSLVALSGLFHLIQTRNLDYPAFYAKLYSLLDSNALHSRHRSSLFRHLDIFLASTHLPAVLVASFLKRIARLALCAPPAAIVVVVPWVYNLIKRHPLCGFLLHRVPAAASSGWEGREEEEGWLDPFDPDEADPLKSGAIDSCLWELVQLQSHWHPNVATIAAIVSEQFTKQSYNIEDFLDHSYASLIDTELSKKMRKAPPVEYMIPKRIFTSPEGGDTPDDTLLARLWELE